GSEIRLRIRRDVPMEIDGEPFLLGPCQIIITRKNQALMLMTEKTLSTNALLHGIEIRSPIEENIKPLLNYSQFTMPKQMK
ncbi:unnamed protein product, partial [Rotaria magnacalcarata]